MAQSQVGDMPTASFLTSRNINGEFDVERQLRMEGGVGEESYARNSSVPAGFVKSAQHILLQALEKVELPNCSTLRIADLGCSSGPNTLSVVGVLVNKLQQRYESEGRIVPEFEVFFSDLPSNDFNTLFSLFPPYDNIASQAITANDLSKRSYFAAGVPGSFYGRLFPSGTLHTVFTAISLHWLSKVPEGVQNKHSPAWNKGQIWISPSNKLAAKGYSKQARDDLRSFLKCRAQEMASGSLLFVLMGGRASTHPEHQFSFLDTDNKDFLSEWMVELENCWNDLIKEGVIEEEIRDSFNLPLYQRSVEEVEEAVRESSEFSIHVLKLLKLSAINCRSESEAAAADGEEVNAKNGSWYSHARSVFGPLIEAHVGSSIAQLFFQRLKARADNNMKRMDKASRYALMAASLIRK